MLEVIGVSIEFLIFSDVHIANYVACSTVQDGVNSRLQACLNTISQVRGYAEEYDIQTTFFLGDLFQSTSRLDVEVLNAAYEALKGWPGELYCLVGNHDLAQPSRGIHALEVFKDQVVVIDRPMGLSLAGIRFFLAPYCRKGWGEKLKRVRADYYLLHQGVEGVPARPGLYLKEHMGLEDLPAEGLIFSGHYHGFQKASSNLIFLGSLLARDWSDVGSKKSFLHVKNGKIKRVLTQAPGFVCLQATSLEELSEQAEAIRGNYVRLEVEPGVRGEELSEAAYSLGALWVGIEGRALEGEQGIILGEGPAITVHRLLRERVKRAHKSLRRRPLFDLGVELYAVATGRR